MGTAIAWRENAPLVPDTPVTKRALKAELRKHVTKLDVVRRLSTYGQALQSLEEPSAKAAKAHYYLLELDPDQDQTRVTGFKRGDLERATEQYLAIEKKLDLAHGAEAVLVSVESLATLQRAYPNYFSWIRPSSLQRSSGQCAEVLDA